MLEDFKLRVFLTVARFGSFTIAARELGISQPAVSQSINTLERELGAKLFVRAKGEVYLSPQGNAFREYASRILYWYDAAGAMFGKEGKLTGNKPVRIASDPIIASYLLPDAIGIMHAARPELCFEIRPLPSGERIAKSVFEIPQDDNDEDDIPGHHFGTPEDADVEITVSPSPETMDFEGECRLAGVMDAAVVASNRNRKAVYAAEASRKPFSTIAGIHVSNRFAVWDGYLHHLTPDLRARIAVVSSSTEAIKSIVENSDNIAGILPEPAVRKTQLVRLPVQLPEFACDISCNPHPDFAARQVCQLLLETLSACAKG